MQLTHQVAEGNGNNKTMLFVIWICNSSVLACLGGLTTVTNRQQGKDIEPKKSGSQSGITQKKYIWAS